MCPAQLNALSDGTDVAGIARYFRARAERDGYLSELVFQNTRGSSWTVLSATYRDVSALALSVADKFDRVSVDGLITSSISFSNSYSSFFSLVVALVIE